MKLAILGTRGVPAAHGGFETFAESLSLYLVDKNWDVTVYCQTEEGEDGQVVLDEWKGVKRVTFCVKRGGALGTMIFDWRSVRHAAASGHKLILTLGYNTAIFCFPYRLKGIRNLINMDGLEWKRDKWKWYERLWLWLNERAGCLLGNHLIADHPEIANHLSTRVSRDKITTIPYGANSVDEADLQRLQELGIKPGRYAVVIARPEPENSIFEIVESFSRQKRGMNLVVLGNYNSAKNQFHRSVIDAASDEVIFPGAIYDKSTVEAIRYYAAVYVHGHRVGGTNPSLVEALGAGSAVLAHDNPFNRWVAGAGAAYFKSSDQSALFFKNLSKELVDVSALKKSSAERFAEEFQMNDVLGRYEKLLAKWA